MSYRVSTSPKINNNNNNNDSGNYNHRNGNSSSPPQDEWVEIVEPKSKTKIYANLETGVCAKHPPDGVTIIKSDKFTDHWWELYDKKTGKYYYYNPEQQKTVWTRPATNNNNNNNSDQHHRVLIIPVSKLQTFRKLSPTVQHREKCDASTQTIASSLVSTGTQTITAPIVANEEPPLDDELHDKLASFDLNSSDVSKSSSSCTHSFNTTTNHSSFKSPLNHRQLSDFTGKTGRVNQYLKSHYNHLTRGPSSDGVEPNNGPSEQQQSHCDQPDRTSQFTRPPLNKSNQFMSLDEDKHRFYQNKETSSPPSSYFGPPSSYHKNRRSVHIAPTTNHFNGSPTSKHNNEYEQSISSTSTFRGSPRTVAANSTNKQNHDDQNQQQRRQQHDYDNGQHHQLITTNNLSHYLVREARAMGIALISDDEVDEDDQDSDDDCIIDEDEDTDLRDDLSSSRGDCGRELNASQEFAEDSSEGWKSFSDQESPNNSTSNNQRSARQHVQRSPILCETSASFTYNELIDDQKDPASCRSQQLDHQKLVQNFKKSRQTSAFGFNDSLGRSYKIDASNAVQRIKNVADSYFATTEQREPMSDKHLRHLSTLSTLPRPQKEKSSTPKQAAPGQLEMDADYDVVEENCGYYSDSEHIQQQFNQSAGGDARKFINATKDHLGHHPSPNNISTSYFDRNKSTRGSTFSVESFARENLTRHPKKGGLLFNRKVKWSRMISWTKNSIKQPMISSVSSDLGPDSIASFKLIQQFMGDRKITITKKYRQLLAQSGVSEESYSSMSSRKGGLGRTSSINIGGHHNNTSSSSNLSSTGAHNHQLVNAIPDRLRDELAYELATKGCSKSALRDEIFVQLARQLTENPNQESVNWGLILVSILLSYFSPSAKFAPFLLSFLETHSHSMAQDVCLPRLDKRLRQRSATYCRRPADGKEISIVRLSITKWPQYCGVFGESLERIMSLQSCSPYLKTLRLPWILTTLGDKLIETGGAQTEGIFRCAADHDLLAQLRLEIDCVDFRKITDARQVKSLLSNVQDPHVIAGLLKLFFRQLYEPVFPSQLYDICLQHSQDGQMACCLFNEHLPNLNKDVLAYLIRMLQMLSRDDKVVAQTKMDNSNLSMVWAPNLLRMAAEPVLPPTTTGKLITSSSSTSDQQTATTTMQADDSSKGGSKWSIATGPNADNDIQQQQQATCLVATPQSQSMIFEQTRQEMQFIRSLIINLDTSFITDVV